MKKRSEAAQQRSAGLAKRKIEVTRKARAMLKRVEEITAAGQCDPELRRLRDKIVGEMWALRHTKRRVKGVSIGMLQ
jgi:hypothetical protein